jgi:pilus assembly protein CpaE
MEAMAHVSERSEATKPAERGGVDGRVVTVFSTKGGVGKTVIATNLAVALVQKCRKRVALLDLDLQFGDVGIMLQTPPERTLFDVAQNFDRLDLDMLRGFLTPHDSGVLALLAPVQPEQAEYVTTARIGRIVEMLRQLVDYVVIDTPAALNDVVLAALDKSDVICAITQMDVASLKNTRIALQKLDQLGYDQGAVRVVLNRADSKVLLQPADVKNAIQRDIAARVPSDRLVPQSVNKGVPVVIDAARSLVARSIFDLAMRIDEDGAEVPQNVA